MKHMKVKAVYFEHINTKSEINAKLSNVTGGGKYSATYIYWVTYLRNSKDTLANTTFSRAHIPSVSKYTNHIRQ